MNHSIAQAGRFLAVFCAVFAAACGGEPASQPAEDLGNVQSEFSRSGYFYDNQGTQCEAGGVGMHCCPDGNAMIGLRADYDVLKCVPMAFSTGIVLATGVPNNVVCPGNQVMVGYHQDMGMAACRTPATGITQVKIDKNGGTQDAWPMHTCPWSCGRSGSCSTWAMSGVAFGDFYCVL